MTGRVALITGGSKGIGRAVALAMAEAGADVAICARKMADLEPVADAVRATGRRAFATVCDVTDAGQVNQLPATVGEALGSIDILVNNAGASESHKFVGHPDNLWARMLEINLTSVYRVCKAIVPGMIERKWGRIITIASISSKVGARYVAAYTASKHGVLGLMRALAVELNPYHITVNAICPGYVDTPMTDANVANMMARTSKSEAEVRKFLEATNPQSRLISPEEVAAVAVMLAGEGARGITAQAINVDGGALVY
ncbi:MAG TPA: SDR family NAD(P)-dependent oxidoreductase [Anaerolineae bacterium]|nr:SDR family NAD(P)-dependent oxidoreductase [Anaerolineae bacterium]